MRKVIFLYSKKKTIRGTTLIEVLVAGVLVSLAAIGILGVFTSGYLVINKAKMLHRATELAREKIEELNNQAIENIYPTLPGTNGGTDEFDGYAEDFEAPIGTPDGYLTSQKFVGQFIPGSDYVVFCPVCGYANRGYIYVDWDDSALLSCSATGLYLDSNDAIDDNGPGGLPDGLIERKVTVAPPCVYKITPVLCQNKDLDGNGVEERTTIHGIKLPRINQSGFYARYVTVKPKRADSAYSDFTYGTVGGTLSNEWAALGLTDLNSLNRTQSRSVPLKEVDVIVKWRAQGESQSYDIKTILSRLAPKYGY